MQSNEHWITPTWPAALQVKALTTLRTGGVSAKPFDSFNLAEHVDDNPSAVKENRNLLRTLAKLPQEPCWINQVHGTTVLNLANYPSYSTASSSFIVPTADASVCINANHISVVLTADCLPILLCDQKGTRVAAVHAGWRGLAAGIVQETVESLDCDPKSLMAWLGPAIGPQVFEVGKDVKDAFNMTEDSSAFEAIATASTKDGSSTEKWLANLYTLARLRLRHLGISQIYGGEFCTFTEKDKFYSFRRSTPTGRQATLIWLES